MLKSQPHLCCSALGSPTAPRSKPGNPTPAGTEREPPTSWRRTPGCRSRAGFQVCGRRNLVPACPPHSPTLLVSQGLRH
nr:CDC42 small effector protein 1 isoform X2 [Globicephala melas]